MGRTYALLVLHRINRIGGVDAACGLFAREEASRNVVGAYAIDATSDEGGVRPAHIKDRIRALGPTVRPDLTLKPADPAAGDWVI